MIKIRVFSFTKTLTIPAVMINGLLLTCLSSLMSLAFAEDEYDSVELIKGITLDYEGAFRFSTKSWGDSRMSYTSGQFAISRNGEGFYIVGHDRHQAIAEFAVPELKASTKASELNFAIGLQPFSSILRNKKRLENPQKLDRISGMELIEGELFVNAVEFYDARADNNQTTFIIRQPQNLRQSKVDGLFKLQGRVHAAGWISKIPKSVRNHFIGSYLLGFTSNYAINSRSSIGPSAFSSNIDAFAGISEQNGLIPTHKMMDFSIKTPIHPDQYNDHKKNNIWTEVSYAAYGFINPNGKYYILVGNSGGHESSIGYKITQNNGNKCFGPCAHDAKDYYNYYWIFDVQDLLKAQRKEIEPHSIQPIKVGKLAAPFQPNNNLRKIIGADFDYTNSRLWVLIENVDKSQNQFEAAPVMVIYKFSEDLSATSNAVNTAAR